MKNMRVGQLSTMLNAIPAPLWVKSRYGVQRVERIKAGFDIKGPDITLVGRNKLVVGEFEDQRVKLCMDTHRLLARDTRGERRLLVFDYCAPQ